MNDITYTTNRPADTAGTDGDVRGVQRRRGHNRGLHAGMLAYDPRVDCGPRHDHLLFTLGRVASESSLAAVTRGHSRVCGRETMVPDALRDRILGAVDARQDEIITFSQRPIQIESVTGP